MCKNEGILSEYFHKFEEEVKILRWIIQEEAERMRDRAHARELRELIETIAADKEIFAKKEVEIAETESKIAGKDREIEKLKKLLAEHNIPSVSAE